jgi:succinate dehydrogenase / fumarate reductase cytochrome b subunit
MSTLSLTIRESLRYRGHSGQWSWLAHRISGLGILAFLSVHVWETAMATYNPAFYNWIVTVFKNPFFGVGEIFLVGAVLYHAFNGIRITLLDFKPEWWQYQAKTAKFVWALFLIIFIPLSIYLFIGIGNYCTELAEAGSSCWAFPAFPGQ